MMKTLVRFLIFAFTLVAGQVYAACSSPVGNAGDTSYASNANMMVYCDGTNWVSMAGGVSVTVGGTTYNNTPGGSANQVQVNNGSGAFAGDSGFTYSGGLATVTNISTTNLSASGNVTAAAFYGDGSHLTGISTQGDRIVSGTLSMLAISNTGYVSMTTGGTNWGYLSSGANYLPSLKTTTLSASTAIQVGSNSLTCSTGISGTMRYSAISSTMEYCNGSAWTSMGPSSTSPVSFLVNKGGVVQSAPTATNTVITWGTVVFDTNNNFASNRFTPTVAGKYLLSASTMWAAPTDGNYWTTRILKNGSIIAQSVITASGGAAISTPVTIVVDANGTSDYFEVGVYQNTGSSQPIDTSAINTYFSGAMLAPQGGSGGGATPAGSTNDVQYNSGGALAADTGAFTYASGLLTAPNISTTNISLSTINGIPYSAASGDRIVSGSVSVVAEQTSGTVRISGTLALVNTGNEICGPATWNSIRIDPNTHQMFLCRP